MHMNYSNPIFKNVVVVILLAAAIFSAMVYAAIPENSVRIHYNRDDESYNNWRLYPWGRDLELSKSVTLQNSLLPSGVDQFGIYFDIPVKENGIRFGYFIHNQGRKSSPNDIKYDLRKYGNEVWQLQSDPVIYAQRPSVKSMTNEAESTLIVQKQNSQQETIKESNELSSVVNNEFVAKPDSSGASKSSNKTLNQSVNNLVKPEKPSDDKIKVAAVLTKAASKTQLEIEQEKLIQLIENNNTKALEAEKVQAAIALEANLTAQSKITASVKVKEHVSPEKNEKVASDVNGNDDSSVKSANMTSLPQKTLELAAFAGSMVRGNPSVLMSGAASSDATGFELKKLPVWIWVALGIFAFVPLMVVVLYKKQMSSMADDSNSSISQTLAKAQVKSISSNTEVVAIKGQAETINKVPELNQAKTLSAESDKSDKLKDLDLKQSNKATIKSEEKVVAKITPQQSTSQVIFAKKAIVKPLAVVKQLPLTETVANNEQEIKATIDNETGLPNKALFVRKLKVTLDNAKENKTKLAIIFIDFDGFKKVNCDFETIRRDMFKSLVARFRASLASADVLCRYEKDRLVVTSEFNNDLKEITRFAQKLVLAGSNPLKVAGETLLIDTSVGISIYPDDGMNPSALLDKAAESIVRAKAKGTNRFQFVSEQMNAQSMQRMAYESSLRNAIDNNELIVNYQPIVETRTQNIVGVEALVRWQHPDLGLIGPAQFINVAEEAGLINDLGMWVLNASCTQGSKWHKNDLNLQLSVNISTKQLLQTDFYESLCQILEDTNFPAESLTLDLQETVILENSQQNQILLERIHQLGVQISIDNFGTGHSSLLQLKNFPVDEIKIDRSFIRTVHNNKTDAETTAGIIALAHNLDIHLVAEGVELQGQREFLMEHNCERMQGSLFCEAKPAAILTALLKQRFKKIEREEKKIEISSEARRFPKGKRLVDSDLDMPLEYAAEDNKVTRLPTKRA